MVYRYKLAKTPKTVGLKTKVVQGVKLNRHEWLYSTERINFGNMTDIVVEEFADSKGVLVQNDKEERKERLDSLKQKGKKIIETQKKNIQDRINKMNRQQLLAKTEYQLKKILHYLKFEKDEYKRLDKNGLVELILLEREVG